MDGNFYPPSLHLRVALGELLNLRVKAVDFEAHTLSLTKEETKGKKARLVLLTPKVEELLRASVAGKAPNDYVLTWGPGKRSKKKAAGMRVKLFKPEWEKLFANAGVKVRLRHDFRRAACGNLRQAGEAVTVIMKILGWSQPEMVTRYDRIDLSDQADAFQALEEKRELNRKPQAERRANEALRQRLDAAQKANVVAAFEAVSPRSAPETEERELRVQ